jgi:phosphate:Na+ symporter
LLEEYHSSIVIALGGVAFFIYGLKMASDSLQRLAADRIRDLITSLSSRPILGVILGILLTLIMQSSGAVTSMLVGLGSAGVIALNQVMGVILGAVIGSTLTVQFLAFDIAQFGLPLFVISFFIFFLSKNSTLKTAMMVLCGFGMIFWGMEMVRMGASILESYDLFSSVLSTLMENPFYTILVTAIFTALVQSSVVTIGIAMTLATQGSIDAHHAIYWVFGANIGTTTIALLAAAGGNSVGKQVAWAHCFYKIASVLLVYPVASWLMELMMSGTPARDVANFNTAYNVLATVIFFPLISYGARVVKKLFPPTPEERGFTTEFLNKENWESPSVVIARSEREILRMGDIVIRMLTDSLNLFRHDDPEKFVTMRKSDDRVDLLSRELSLYLAKHLDQAAPSFHKQMIRQLNFVADLESAADVVENQLLELALKKHKLKLEFSKEGWTDLEELLAAVRQVAEMSLVCFQRQDEDLAARVVFHKRNIRKLEERMRENHITRLVKGRPESINTSSIHLDVLGEYRRVAGLMSNHVYQLLKSTDPYNILPRRE